LGKFDEKLDDGIFVGYSTTSKAFRVYNIRTRKVEENLHITFLENKPMIAGKGESFNACQSSMEIGSSQDYILIPLWKDTSLFDSSSQALDSHNKDNHGPSLANKKDVRIFDDDYDDRDEGAEADYNNLEIVIPTHLVPIALFPGGIQHQTSVARTPEQNGVVERRNRTFVEAARTMLSAVKVLFFWAEATVTACFTQNRSLVMPRHEKTPYHIINERKPSVKFFHIFGSVCYIVKDGENLDKMKEKGDECIFVGYSTQSRAYRVFNKRTRVIMESIHVNFDELPQMAPVHNSSDPAPTCQTKASVQILSRTKPKNIMEAMADSAWIESMQE
nr:retrovirus-related Pol polyprotein from transposon TNT 1-94 [Tanacetum cinerariifolium]